MAAEIELLARDGLRRRRGTVPLALLMTVTTLATWHLVGTSGVDPSVRITAQGPAAAPARVITVTGAAARRLSADVAGLQVGRIDCGAPGPGSVRLTFAGGSYDVNGECVRVVRDGPSTPLVESAAPHHDLTAVLQR